MTEQKTIPKIVKRLGLAGTIAAVGLVGTCMGYASCTTYVKPGEVAVKESKFGQGLDLTKVYEGKHLYFTPPGVTFNKFPKTAQVLDYNSEEFEAGLERTVHGYEKENSLSVRSPEGHDNKFDVTVRYHIADTLKLLKTESGVGKGDLYVEHMKSKIPAALNEAFGKQSSEKLYDVPARQTASEKTKEILNASLAHVGIVVDDVLVRKFAYIDSYEQRLEEKALQDQLKETNTMLATANKEGALVAKIEAEGAKLVEVEKSRAARVKTETTAQGDLYFRSKTAESDLILNNAKAEGQRLVNDSLIGEGADKIVGLEMAQKTAAAIKNVYVQSCSKDGANPLDLKAMGKKLSGAQ